MPEVKLVRSIQRRVTQISAISVVLALVIGVVGLEWTEKIEHEQMLDVRLKKLAEAVHQFVGNPPALAGVEQRDGKPLVHARIATKGEPFYRYQVWNPDGTLLLHNLDASSIEPLVERTRFGFSTVDFGGELHRVYAMQTPNNAMVVQVSEPLNERVDDLRLVIGYYLVTLLLPFALAIGASQLLMRHAFRSLDELALRMRQHHLLDVNPLALDQAPREFGPMLHAVNELFHRTGHAFSLEQRFTAMAAHELRTPWAGIRGQAQIASVARTDEELQTALHAVMDGVDRASHVFDQLLDLTRVECLDRNISASFQRVHWPDIFDRVTEELQCKVAARHIVVRAKFLEENIYGLEFAIYTLLRNLVSNAILYAPFEGLIEVMTHRQGQVQILNVDDSGPGIPPMARASAFERFNRLGKHDENGVGLGLSIVAQVVALHQASISLLDSPLGGLRVHVEFKLLQSGQVEVTSAEHSS